MQEMSQVLLFAEFILEIDRKLLKLKLAINTRGNLVFS